MSLSKDKEENEAWRPLIENERDEGDKFDDKNNNIFVPHPFKKANFIDKIFFNWVSPVVSVSFWYFTQSSTAKKIDLILIKWDIFIKD